MDIRLFLKGLKKRMASYSRFALYYDILTKNISYKSRAEYFDRLIKKFDGTKGILLDFACGTGSLSEEFAKMGYDVIAIDKSQEMLTMALEKKIESGLPIQYLNQDMTKLNLFGGVDVTICALDSLNHLSDISAVRKAFKGVSKFSNPGALFIFDVNTPYKHKNIIGNNTFVYDADEVYCVWQNTYNQNKVEIHLDFFEKDGNVYFKTEEDFTETAFEVSELEKALTDSGLEILAEYDYDTENPVRDDSEKIVFVARKVK